MNAQLHITLAIVLAFYALCCTLPYSFLILRTSTDNSDLPTNDLRNYEVKWENYGRSLCNDEFLTTTSRFAVALTSYHAKSGFLKQDKA